MRLAAGVGALGALVTLAIITKWIWTTRSFSCPIAIQSNLPADQAGLLIQDLYTAKGTSSPSTRKDTPVRVANARHGGSKGIADRVHQHVPKGARLSS